VNHGNRFNQEREEKGEIGSEGSLYAIIEKKKNEGEKRFPAGHNPRPQGEKKRRCVHGEIRGV